VNRHLLIAVALLAGLAACSSSRSGRASKDAGEASDIKPDGKGLKLAPDFSLPDPDGKAVRLSDFKGKVVLLDFWATWCGPCKIEIPWFIEFQRKYKDQGFTVLGVSMDEGGWSEVRPFVDQMKMNYPVLLGNDDMTAPFGGIEVLPTTLIIDKQGRVFAMHKGLTSKDDFENAIKGLL
jgi:cytochrome c biogenesis protein CcmG/thiol:disulfide interchange protein DsbE